MSVLPYCRCRTKAIQSGRSSSPNVILIYRDDLRIGDLSCYGATQVSAPHIDRLAGEGLRFTNAYATSATSTIALWVADRHLSLEKRQYQDCTGNSGLLIDTATVTVGDVFQRAGYTTGVNCIIPLQTLLKKTMWSVNTPMWLKSYLLYWIPFVQSIKIKM